MSDKPDGERISVLEVESESHTSKITDLTKSVEEINKNVGLILIQMAGNKGFFHGIVFTLSIIGGLVGAFATEIWHSLVGK